MLFCFIKCQPGYIWVAPTPPTKGSSWNTGSHFQPFPSKTLVKEEGEGKKTHTKIKFKTLIKLSLIVYIHLRHETFRILIQSYYFKHFCDWFLNRLCRLFVTSFYIDYLLPQPQKEHPTRKWTTGSSK